MKGADSYICFFLGISSAVAQKKSSGLDKNGRTTP